MLKHAALEAKIGYDIAENEPQQDVEQRTKEGGTQLYFLSVTAALPLDDTGISWITSAVDLISAHVRGTSRQQIGTKCMKDTDIAFDKEQPPARGEHVYFFNGVSNINSMFHNNMATWIFFLVSKKV